MLEGQDLYSIMTNIISHSISVIIGVIHCWVGGAKEEKNISPRLCLLGFLPEIALQIKCTDVQ